MSSISIIVFGAEEGQELNEFLAHLQPLRAEGAQIILIGSDTLNRQNLGLDQVFTYPGTVAERLNAAATASQSDVLVFMHATTLLPESAASLINHALMPGNRVWGRFDLRYSGTAKSLRLIERITNIWSRYLGRASLRQGIFVNRLAYELAGRFPELPLFTDIAFCTALRQLSRPACIRTPAVASSVRLEARGIWRSILVTAWLRLSYTLGVEPGTLRTVAQRYRVLEAVNATELNTN